MFGKKKEKSPAALGFSLFNQEGERTAQHAAVSLPLNREAVLEKSIEFFQDPHPCAIHEGAVRMRMLGELEAYLKGKGLVRLSEMPDSWFISMEVLFMMRMRWNAERCTDRKSTRLNSSHSAKSRMPSSA